MERQKVEMAQNGFTLVELMVTIAVIAILASLATVQFRKMATNASIEKELTAIYTDLMELRTRALYEKEPRAARLTATEFSIYPGADTDSPPIMTRSLAHAVTWSGGGSSLTLRYDTFGISNTAATLCVEPGGQNSSAVDSIIVSRTRIRMGKRKAACCVAESVALK